MLAARNGDQIHGAKLGIGVQVVGDHRLLDPSQIVGGQHPQHAFGIFQRPAHIGVGHDVYRIADRLTRGADKVQVAVHAGQPVLWPPSKAQFNGAKALISIGFRLRVQSVEGLGV